MSFYHTNRRVGTIGKVWLFCLACGWRQAGEGDSPLKGRSLLLSGWWRGQSLHRLVLGNLVGSGSDGNEAVFVVVELHACHGDTVADAKDVAGCQKMLS